MVFIGSFQKFHAVISELKETGAQCKLYGNMSEVATGARLNFDSAPNNMLRISILAFTSVGTIYCANDIKLSDNDAASAKENFKSLSVTDAKVSYNHDTGVAKIL